MLSKWASSSRPNVSLVLFSRLSARISDSARQLSSLKAKTVPHLERSPKPVRRPRPKPGPSGPTEQALYQFWSPHTVSAFARKNPLLPLPLLLEILTIVRDLPDKVSAKVPEQIENRVLEIAGKQGASPRMAIACVAERFPVGSVVNRKGGETCESIALLVERLMRISWNNGDTDWPNAGASLIAPLVLRDRRVAAADGVVSKLLCSQEEAAQIYSRLMMAQDDVSLLAALSWAKRLKHLISSRNGDSVSEVPGHVKTDFDDAIQNMFQLIDQSSSVGLKYRALMFLATEYAEGFLLPRNGDRVKECWERALSVYPPGHLAGSAPAFRLGQVYLGQQPPGADLLFEPDTAKGLAYFELAKTGNAKAAYHLGRRYYLNPHDASSLSLEEHVKAKGVEPDDTRAAENFYLGMIRGSILAKIAFVEMILLGRAQPPIVEEEANEPPNSEELTEDGLDNTGPERRLTQFAARPGDGNLLYAFDLAWSLFRPHKHDWHWEISRDSPIRKIFDPVLRKSPADMSVAEQAQGRDDEQERWGSESDNRIDPE